MTKLILNSYSRKDHLVNCSVLCGTTMDENSVEMHFTITEKQMRQFIADVKALGLTEGK